jgi:transposase-like protein
MRRGKKHTAEQIVNLLRQVEVGVANGKTVPQACKEAEIVEQTYYRWRKEYGGLKVDQARRLKELEQENAKLKRLVSELSLEKLVLVSLIEVLQSPNMCWPVGSPLRGIDRVQGNAEWLLDYWPSPLIRPRSTVMDALGRS